MILCFRMREGPMKGHRFIVKLNSSRHFAIGRSKNSTICVHDDPSVSRNHAKIYIMSQYLVIEDANSKNGTYVSGHRIRERQRLDVGAQILIGKSILQYDGLRNA